LRQTDLPIAPKPLFLDRDTYAQPVVVQSWLEGKVIASSPATLAEWHKLLEHLSLIHTVTPDRVDLKLQKSRIHAASAEDGRRIVKQQLAHIPPSARDPLLQAILARFEQIQFPEWPEPTTTLCRLDNNTANYVRRSGLWASVDWEYSGWGDPAFDVANLLTHVACLDSPSSQWIGPLPV
jgi:thiamine kinase-like enzyme